MCPYPLIPCIWMKNSWHDSEGESSVMDLVSGDQVGRVGGNESVSWLWIYGGGWCTHYRLYGGKHGVLRIILICRVNQLAQGYKKSTFHRYVPLHRSIKANEIVCKSTPPPSIRLRKLGWKGWNDKDQRRGKEIRRKANEKDPTIHDSRRWFLEKWRYWFI